MRVVTAGIGLRAGHVLSLMKEEMPEMEIVGYFDPQPSHLDMIGADVPEFGGVQSMLEKTQPDLLFVGSPNEFHLEQIKLGLEAGVRVFAEKPVVTTLDQTWALLELLENYGVDRVMVGLVLRYSQHMVDLRAALKAGLLGKIASLDASEFIAPYHGAFFMRDWRRMSAHSGGFMLEKCCHDLDLYNMITASRPIRVASFGARRSFLAENAPVENSAHDVYHVKISAWNSVDDPFRSDGDIIDCQTAILEYQSGASLAFHTNINVPDEHRRFCVIGSKGMAEGDFVRGYLRVTRSHDNERLIDKDYTASTEQVGAHYGADRMMVKDIVRFLRGQTDCLPVSVVDALVAGIAALALDDAREQGSVVDLKPIWKKFDSYDLATGSQ